ncbi:hypothetical protein [Streptomyces sp. NBC_00306]|uniref:hypothetical protein n=1 Tax=Streptomyces sp. NBC_00306 TaxID=2975708 RepID=UPI002E2A8514|nr:hypothetical protein [Streptomyces sp. NBC_00306]
MVILTVLEEVTRELDQLGTRGMSAGLTAVALDLAAAMDSTEAPTSKAVVARELSAVMVKLRALANPTAGRGTVDDLKRKRAERLQRTKRAAP